MKKIIIIVIILFLGILLLATSVKIIQGMLILKVSPHIHDDVWLNNNGECLSKVDGLCNSWKFGGNVISVIMKKEVKK